MQPDGITPTPILDSGVLPPRRRKNAVLGFVFGMLIGALFVLVIIKASNSESQTNIAAVSYLLVFTLAVLIHELGHLVAGWIVGFHFNMIALGPVVFGFEYGKLKIRLVLGTGMLGYAGVQIDRVVRLRHRFLLFIVGGPAANLISAAVAVGLVKYLFLNSWMVPVLVGFVYISLLIGVVGVLPLWPKSRSDGSRIWMLLTSREKTRRLLAAMALVNQTRLGTPLKAWKKTWMNATTSVRDESFDEFTANWIAFCAASSRKDLPKVTAHLERCLGLAYMLPDSKRDEIAREAGIYAAWFRNDAVAAEKWIGQMKYPKQTTKMLQLRLQVVLDCARKDFARAFEGMKEGAEFIESLPETPYRTLLKESWKEWEGDLKEKQNELVNTGA
jgi:hypothetical protein